MNILFTILSNIIWMIVDTVIPGYVFLLFLQKYDGGGGERERKRRRRRERGEGRGGKERMRIRELYNKDIYQKNTCNVN